MKAEHIIAKKLTKHSIFIQYIPQNIPYLYHTKPISGPYPHFFHLELVWSWYGAGMEEVRCE